MAAVRHLGFVMPVWGPPMKAFGGLYHCAKFGWNHCSSFDNMHVIRFRGFLLENAYSRPKIGGFTGKIGEGVGDKNDGKTIHYVKIFKILFQTFHGDTD